MKLLANRIQHLQLAEERARKKIAETKSRTSEIMALKNRNLRFAEQKKRLKAEREITISALQQAVTTAKVSQREHIRASRALAESRRRDTSNKVKQTLDSSPSEDQVPSTSNFKTKSKLKLKV